jgi:hypothetical protein
MPSDPNDENIENPTPNILKAVPDLDLLAQIAANLHGKSPMPSDPNDENIENPTPNILKTVPDLDLLAQIAAHLHGKSPEPIVDAHALYLATQAYFCSLEKMSAGEAAAHAAVLCNRYDDYLKEFMYDIIFEDSTPYKLGLKTTDNAAIEYLHKSYSELKKIKNSDAVLKNIMYWYFSEAYNQNEGSKKKAVDAFCKNWQIFWIKSARTSKGHNAYHPKVDSSGNEEGPPHWEYGAKSPYQIKEQITWIKRQTDYLEIDKNILNGVVKMRKSKLGNKTAPYSFWEKKFSQIVVPRWDSP